MPFTPDQLQIPFGGRSPASRHRSYKAALGQRALRGAKRRRMMAYIDENGPTTDTELYGALQPITMGGVCSLRNSLVADGYLEEAGEKLGPYGHMNTLWRRRGTTAQAKPNDEAVAC